MKNIIIVKVEMLMYSRQYIDDIFKELDSQDKYARADAILDIFGLIYDERDTDSPEWLNAFIEISTWESVSLRDGVWTYYEGNVLSIVEQTSQFLKSSTYTELYEMYTYAMHDYSSEISDEQMEVWIRESEKVDEWILKNEIQIDLWLKNILCSNKEQICSY